MKSNFSKRNDRRSEIPDDSFQIENISLKSAQNSNPVIVLSPHYKTIHVQTDSTLNGDNTIFSHAIKHCISVI